MKISTAAVCLISGLFMSGINSHAIAQEMHPDRHGGAEATHEHWQDPVAATQKHLADLKQKLNLKPSQQTAWETFSNAITAQAKAQAQSGEKMKGMRGPDDENMSTPERMEKMVAMMRANADNLSKLTADTKTFYNGLSVEQKTIFDLLSKMAWHHRMMERMHHGDMD